MKTQHLLPLILGILCFSCNQGEKTKNDLEIMNLYGKVISLEVVSFEAVEKFGEIELGERKQENLLDKDSYIIFNENGNIETISKYLSNGSFDRKIIYDYNEKKQIVEINYYLKDQSLYYKEKYIYNNQNLLINSYGYNSDGELEESSSFQYDNKENATEAIYKSNSEYGHTGKYAYEYNEKGELIESIYYTLEGEKESSNKFAYDNNGNRLFWALFNEFGELTKRTIYKYDDNKNLIEETEYDSNDRIIKTNKYIYDHFNNLTEEHNLNPDGSYEKLINFKYEYDDKNNWVKKIKLINDVPKFITIRFLGYNNRKGPELIDIKIESTNESTKSQTFPKKASTPQITYAKYSKIKDGMNYKDVVNILGVNGKELSRTSIGGYTTVMLMWENPDGSNMNVMFQNGEVITKAQFGLK